MAEIAFIFLRNQEIQSYCWFKVNICYSPEISSWSQMAVKTPDIMTMVNAGKRNKRILFYDENENIPRSTRSRHSLCLFAKTRSQITSLCDVVRENGEQDDHNWFTTVWGWAHCHTGGKIMVLLTRKKGEIDV